MAKDIHTTDTELMAIIGVAADAMICEKYGDATDSKTDEVVEVAAMISHKVIGHLTGEKKLDQRSINKLMAMKEIGALLALIVFDVHKLLSSAEEDE